MNTLEKFYTDAEKFLILVNEFAEKNEILNFAAADHIGYKCSSREEYENWRSIFEMNCAYIHQSIISKRRVSIIRLGTPLRTVLGEINFLELSDQKPDGSQTDGFDHVEAYPKGVAYEELVAILEKKGNIVEEVRKPHHSTHNIKLLNGFKLKIEPEALMEKIKREEIF